MPGGRGDAASAYEKDYVMFTGEELAAEMARRILPFLIALALVVIGVWEGAWWVIEHVSVHLK